MSRATVELDFFGLENKENSSNKPQFKKFPRQRSFRDIQGAISKINPEIIKSVIASGSAKSSISLPSTPKEEPITFPDVPLYRHIPKSGSENVSETAPLTIFYNGTVAVFDVHREKAEHILKLAVEGNSKSFESNDANVASDQQQQLLETLNTGDLPIARRKSLQRFLEKRKERNDMESDIKQLSD
ncbi:hypothetical protein CICLE_v10032858mg [Citrus x clementina]|uniref:Protein TIFY n=1 Tax=Citrus clementina TaxID=85681 RepID=V4VHK0_CITCL|nr:protein TIFY 9 isoform X1 [Citrus x clementina]XP_006483020.1 protein TIFY 9 isoform X2 [Citrus sinensis]ESR52084.1 hypothetical protein CICLE_v10032858mg [Citrus x clementina]